MFQTKMIFGPMTEEQRSLMSYTQAELHEKHRRINESVALWILAAFGLAAALSNQVILSVLYEDGSAVTQILITSGLLLFCVVCGFFAVVMIRKPATSLAEDIGRIGAKGLYTAEEICDYYREVRENPGNLIFLFGKDKIDPSNRYSAGVFTKNWMKVHDSNNFVKLSDIVAAWHNIDHDGTECTGFYLLRIDGLKVITECSQEFSDRILQEIGKLNPLTFLARRFLYEGKQYDVLINKESVIALYKSKLEQYMNRSAGQ